MIRTMRLATNCLTGRRTMWIPDRRQKRLVSSRSVLTQPRRPASTTIAGKSVTDVRNPMAMVIARAGPMVENTPSWRTTFREK